jgi:hypothetical protein
MVAINRIYPLGRTMVALLGMCMGTGCTGVLSPPPPPLLRSTYEFPHQMLSSLESEKPVVAVAGLRLTDDRVLVDLYICRRNPTDAEFIPLQAVARDLAYTMGGRLDAIEVEGPDGTSVQLLEHRPVRRMKLSGTVNPAPPPWYELSKECGIQVVQYAVARPLKPGLYRVRLTDVWLEEPLLHQRADRMDSVWRIVTANYPSKEQ